MTGNEESRMSIDMQTMQDRLGRLCEEYRRHNGFNAKDYQTYGVKRGLRNPDGTGVMAGLTNICNVHGYVVNEGEKMPIEGQLIYRGYDVRDLVGNAVKENRFGFEEVVYLLLMGDLPNKDELAAFRQIIAEKALYAKFTQD